jgi:meiotically up-regulated gene 157 (Mug157) protein
MALQMPRAFYANGTTLIWKEQLNPVFKLVPPVFAHYAGQVYTGIGSPQLNVANIWDVSCLLQNASKPPWYYDFK